MRLYKCTLACLSDIIGKTWIEIKWKNKQINKYTKVENKMVQTNAQINKNSTNKQTQKAEIFIKNRNNLRRISVNTNITLSLMRIEG